MTDLTPRDIAHLDQAAVDALSDVDALAADPETARRLAERGEAVYGFELTRDLQAAHLSPWALAGWAAFATIRLVQAKAATAAEVAETARIWAEDADQLHATIAQQKTELERLREQVFTQQPVLDAVQAWAELVETDGSAPAHASALVTLHQAVEQYRVMDLALTNARTEAATPTEQQYLIWSHHHKVWWGANGSGYRSNPADAGQYTLADTAKWLGRGCYCCQVPELPIPAEKVIGKGDRSVWGVITAATRAAVKAGQVNRHYDPAVAR
ncbi:hypothetical protein TPA0907_55480 [Micromonospora humidisoli]|uniref:hypothetical protein n=1 Tax=Micromonospora sp. AKA109 TaxID=2733865 RepID=UPI0022C4D9E3|nr:hypothetical protein [Micromonospora sp. AKA109]GHJ11181.1 hypothetical protein TPA0907_55480 [Micromonospora sp. AKA109]